jgi:hypothetical protein
MNTKPQSQNILFIGLDWADQEHVCCLNSSAADTEIVETIQHDPEEIAQWVSGLKKRFPGHRLLVALEQSRGAVIWALAEHQELELFPINPRQLSVPSRISNGNAPNLRFPHGKVARTRHFPVRESEVRRVSVRDSAGKL